MLVTLQSVRANPITKYSASVTVVSVCDANATGVVVSATGDAMSSSSASHQSVFSVRSASRRIVRIVELRIPKSVGVSDRPWIVMSSGVDGCVKMVA